MLSYYELQSNEWIFIKKFDNIKDYFLMELIDFCYLEECKFKLLDESKNIILTNI